MYKLLLVLIIGLTSCISAEKQIIEKSNEISIYEAIGDSVFRVGYENSWGTAFAVRTRSGKKVLITNDHVCDGLIADKKKDKKLNNLIYDSYGNKWKMKILAKYKYHDLCMLAAPRFASTLKLAVKNNFREKVFTAGFPSIKDMTTGEGVILKMDYAEDFPYPLEPKNCKGSKYKIKNILHFSVFGPVMVPTCLLIPPRLQTSIKSGGGASGSPIVNKKGEVSGVVLGIAGQLGFTQVVPLKYLRNFLDNH